MHSEKYKFYLAMAHLFMIKYINDKPTIVDNNNYNKKKLL